MKPFLYKGQIITASCKQEAIAQIVQASRPLTVQTGLNGRANKALIENTLANMPDSKTEGCEVVLDGGKVVLKIQGNNYLTKDRACFHIAKNIKRIVKKTKEWSRSNNKAVKELSDSKNKFSVRDCYSAYDILLGRNTEKFSYDGDESFCSEYAKAIVKECNKLSVKPKIETKEDKKYTKLNLSFAKLAHTWNNERKPHIPSIEIWLYNTDPDNDEIHNKKFRKMAINYAGLVLDGPDYCHYCGYSERAKLGSPKDAAETCTKLINNMFKVYEASVEYDNISKKAKLKANSGNENLQNQLRKAGEKLERLDDVVRKWDNR